MNDYLKRGSGKNKGDIKKYDFFSHYRKNTSFDKLDRKTYDSFLTEVLKELGEKIVRENLEVKLGVLGYIRVQARKLNFFDKEGKLSKSLKPNWKASWELWRKTYPELSDNEITEIEGKKLIYYENEHSNGEFYMHIWDNSTALVKFKSFYKFKPSRKYSRMINEEVRKEPRTVFYYG